MNLVLTTKCNKNCNFCFSNGTHNPEHTDMYMDDFEFLVKNSNERINILGGEPTQSNQFIEAINIVEKHNKNATLVSNLLFNDEILEFINNKIQKRTIGLILANASYLDIKNRFNLFQKNYNSMLKTFSDNQYSNPLKRISIGLTIEQHLDEDYYVNYYKMLIENIKFKRLRISLDYPSDEKKKLKNKYINDKKTGKILYQLWKISMDNGIFFAGDCNFYPCMFEDQQFKNLMSGRDTEIFTICKSCAADVNPDMTVNYCYPVGQKIGMDLKSTHSEKINGDYIIDHLSDKYDEVFSIDIIPNECKDCKYFKDQICEGPCLGLLL